MIGVINPNATETLDVQLEFTKNSTTQMTPGEAMPSETAASTSTATAAAGSTSAGSKSGGSHLSAGAIAGIAIGAVVVFLLAATLIYLCGRRGGLYKAYDRQKRHTGPPPMVEARYTGGGGGGGNPPKSPGQETFSTTAYSSTPSNDPYQQASQQTGHGVPGYSVGSGSPPPVSVHSRSSYQQFGSAPGTMQTGFL